MKRNATTFVNSRSVILILISTTPAQSRRYLRLSGKDTHSFRANAVLPAGLMMLAIVVAACRLYPYESHWVQRMSCAVKE
jgi:hypothetical protein